MISNSALKNSASNWPTRKYNIFSTISIRYLFLFTLFRMVMTKFHSKNSVCWVKNWKVIENWKANGLIGIEWVQPKFNRNKFSNLSHTGHIIKKPFYPELIVRSLEIWFTEGNTTEISMAFKMLSSMIRRMTIPLNLSYSQNRGRKGFKSLRSYLLRIRGTMLRC